MRAFLTAILLSTFLLASCGDDSVQPDSERPATLYGQVTSPDGTPIAGARVTAQLGIDGIELPGWDDPAKRASLTLNFASATRGHVLLQILDFAGGVVRVLLDESIGAEERSVTWDASDDAGRPVPPGSYIAQLDITPDAEGESTRGFHRPLLLYFTDARELFERPHAITDAQGEFSIPLDLFGVGETMMVTDEGGNATPHEISHRVQVHAFRGDDAPTQMLQRFVLVPDRNHPVRLDLVLTN